MSESNQAQTGFRFGVVKIIRKARERRRLINIILALAGMSIIFFYTTCRGSCTYSQESFAGIDLKYLGITYMGLIILFNLLRRDTLNLLLLVLGMGAEIYLIGYQIRTGLYCPCCLMFAAVVIVLFTFNFEKSKKALIVAFLILGFFLLFALFRGTLTPSYAADTIMPFFGKGKIEVRLYTDYFCDPCASIEPKLEPTISDLVGKNVITIAFIDTPLHKQASLYIRYFLYILNEGNDFNRALLARKVLFEAARGNITEKEKIEDLLRERNVKFKPFNPKPTFDIFSRYLAEDGVTSTPTIVVIRQDGGKKKFCGTSDVLTAIEGMKRR
ncbi:MAG: thioredoxin domain-containing protein [Syntrophales bacterium]|nr:thioredoxin domain-containing protein [Syntrophales bacterium]